MHILHYTKIFH